MKRILFQSIRLTLVFTALTGLFYPLVVTGLAQWLFRDQANGSLVLRDGEAVGSALLAQSFTSLRYFWSRPSSYGYSTVPSGASNLGPTSRLLQSNVSDRVRSFRAANGLADGEAVPADFAYASGSGLDPHISPEAAHAQIARVAAARQLEPAKVDVLVTQFVEPPQLGFLGEPRVNVLLLNLALDRIE
jgi:K+-transporting ATPase ATPase C chain